jgi:hypothetical protein
MRTWLSLFSTSVQSELSFSAGGSILEDTGSCCAQGLAFCSRHEEISPRASHTGVNHLLGRLSKGHVVFLLKDKSRGQ